MQFALTLLKGISTRPYFTYGIPITWYFMFHVSLDILCATPFVRCKSFLIFHLFMIRIANRNCSTIEPVDINFQGGEFFCIKTLSYQSSTPLVSLSAKLSVLWSKRRKKEEKNEGKLSRKWKKKSRRNFFFIFSSMSKDTQYLKDVIPLEGFVQLNLQSRFN